MIFRSTSRRPIVIAGNGVRESGAVETLRRFYRKTRIPVITTMNGVDIMHGDDKIGFIGVYGNRVANLIVSQADLVISIGARLGLRQIGNKREYFAPKAFLIRADIDQYELGRDIKDNEDKYLIDANEFINKLLEEDIPTYDVWNEKCFAAKKMLEPYDKNLGNICIEKVSNLLPLNAIVALDIGQTQCWAAQSLTLKGDNSRILIGGSYGSMGCGLPYAIGASIAEKRPVYCITGDGGLQMNIQELQTVASEKLPIKIFVVNNRALGKIVEIQASYYNHRMLITDEKSGYTVPDFKKVADAYGIRATNIDNIELLDNYAEWLVDDEACLINILLPEAVVLQPKMNWNDREMKPLIDQEILRKIKIILSDF